jgi:hypothetical protein
MALYSDYDPGLVAALKSRIPATSRKWNPTAKCWEFDPSWAGVVSDLCLDHLGQRPQMPAVQGHTRPQSETRLLQVEYIGQLKDRGDGELTAFGAVADHNTLLGKWSPVWGMPEPLAWNMVFSEKVLKDWFEGDNQKDTLNITTLYAMLALKRTATQDEVKKAWRKMARRYHPDVNHDDDAHVMMQKINDAYEVLRNPNMRKRYDAGLQLEASIGQAKPSYSFDTWRPPIRCGLIMATGHEKLGRFVIEKINEWHDIVENGMTLVTSWDLATNSLVREWI